jgi:hypothetical protein
MEYIISQIRIFIQGIKNIIKWMPIIYKDRDWDYGFTLDLLKKKLEYKLKFFNSSDAHLESSQFVADRIKLIIRLLDRGFYDKYKEDFDDTIIKIYGNDLYNKYLDYKFSKVFMQSKFNNFIEISGEKVPSNITPNELEDIKQISSLYTKQIPIIEEKTERAKVLFWKFLSKDLERFWD